MREVGILEAKTKFSALVSDVERGAGEVTVTRHGRPVVKIVRVGDGRQRKVSGEDLVRRMEALHESIVERDPEQAFHDRVGIIRRLRDEGDAD